MIRFILYASPENIILATRAARWLLQQPLEQKDGIISFGEARPYTDFYVERNKTSISARELPSGK